MTVADCVDCAAGAHIGAQNSTTTETKKQQHNLHLRIQFELSLIFIAFCCCCDRFNGSVFDSLGILLLMFASAQCILPSQKLMGSIRKVGYGDEGGTALSNTEIFIGERNLTHNYPWWY